MRDIEMKRIRGKLPGSSNAWEELSERGQSQLGELSCAECRRLKLKCDKKVPCGSCVRRGCESICPCGEWLVE
jgi:hypothetical protein